jgi:acetyl-CoA/propionyl-CoA carboxylase biotin carboxyl carrier protein
MKMEQPLTAHKSGVIKKLHATAGGTVGAGEIIAVIADA